MMIYISLSPLSLSLEGNMGDFLVRPAHGPGQYSLAVKLVTTAAGSVVDNLHALLLLFTCIVCYLFVLVL